MNNTRAEDFLCFIARFALSKAMLFSFFTVHPFMTKMYAHYEKIPRRRGTYDRLINKAKVMGRIVCPNQSLNVAVYIANCSLLAAAAF